MIFPLPAHHANKVSFLKKSNSSDEHIDTNLPSSIYKEQAFPKHNPGISFSSSNTIYLISLISIISSNIITSPHTTPPHKSTHQRIKNKSKKVIINKTRNTSPNHIYIFTSIHHSKRKKKKNLQSHPHPKATNQSYPFPISRGISFLPWCGIRSLLRVPMVSIKNSSFLFFICIIPASPSAFLLIY